VIGVILGFLIAWNFKPNTVKIVDKVIEVKTAVEVIPPLNCVAIKTPSKFEYNRDLGVSYSRLKTAYSDCMASIQDTRIQTKEKHQYHQ
jgi:hypothetical protein